MSPEEGVLYTPEQVRENGWLGPDTTPTGLRKAASRGDVEHTKFRGRIYFTRANILAIQAAGFVPAKADRRPAGPARRGRRAVAAVPDLPTGAQPLVARPNAARPTARRRRAS